MMSCLSLFLFVCLSVCLSYVSHDSTKHMLLHRFLPTMAPSGLQSPVSLSPCPLTFKSIQLQFLVFFHFLCFSVLFMKTFVFFHVLLMIYKKFLVFSFLNFFMKPDRQTGRQTDTDRHRQTDDVLSLSLFVCLSVCLMLVMVQQNICFCIDFCQPWPLLVSSPLSPCLLAP